MAKFIVVIFACLALASAGLVRRDAPNMFDEWQKHAQEFQKIFNDQLNALTSSKNTEEFNKVLKEGSDSVLSQISALSGSVQSALKEANGKAKEALEQAQANLQRTAEELRKSHPEVEQQANALKAKLQDAVSKTVAETQKLVKEVSANIEQTNQKLTPKIKEAYDDFVKQAEDVQKKLHEAANKQ
ncbi:unnamed protein product [Danaus chrysippus]|uniref:(African queen) hypothetical protein n=1 Tax=Danaus chrysippus TaxID=151541 RepID=A0A8J2Q1W6_9NEOP|nr:unnamed protein product [Danaus chrysippus]